MPAENCPDRRPLNGRLQGRDEMAVMCREVADEIRLLQEISHKAEQETYCERYDLVCRRKRQASLEEEKDAGLPDTVKRPAPKYNKTLKEAEQAALHKPLTRKRYHQLMKEHVELLPYMFKIIDKNSSRSR